MAKTNFDKLREEFEEFRVINNDNLNLSEATGDYFIFEIKANSTSKQNVDYMIEFCKKYDKNAKQTDIELIDNYLYISYEVEW